MVPVYVHNTYKRIAFYLKIIKINYGFQKAEEFCDGGHEITDMYTRCGIYGTEMVNKLDRLNLL